MSVASKAGEPLDVAKKLAADVRFKWEPGMRDQRGFLRGFSGWLFEDDDWCPFDEYEPHIPDLDDLATYGYILGMACKAWFALGPNYSVESGRRLGLKWVTVRDSAGGINSTFHATGVEAAALCLFAAWEKSP